MGAAISERTAELLAADKYQDYLMLHGLGVEMAEALAEFWHRRIREEWGFADEDGPSSPACSASSFAAAATPGVPGLPDLEDNSGSPNCSMRSPRHRGQRGDGVPVPPGADDECDYPPPSQGQVFRRPLTPSELEHLPWNM